jgi:hypothetical protein
MKLMRPKLTSAHAIALLALFVSLSGTVYAAGGINGTSILKASIPGNRLKKDSLSGAQVNEDLLGTVPKAASADKASEANTAKVASEANTAKVASEANTAKVAGEAKVANEAKTSKIANEAVTAQSASNTLALGGIPASGYQRSCQRGTVKGFVTLNTAGINDETGYFAEPGFSCSDQSPEFRRGAGPGSYFVRFPGAAPEAALVSAATNGEPIAAKVRKQLADPIFGGETFLIQVFNTTNDDMVDNFTFTLVVM